MQSRFLEFKYAIEQLVSEQKLFYNHNKFNLKELCTFSDSNNAHVHYKLLITKIRTCFPNIHNISESGAYHY